MNDLVTLTLKLPRDTEVTPEATLNFLSSLLGINKTSSLQRIFSKGSKSISLEIVFSSQQISFQVTCHSSLSDFILSQLQSSYPLVNIKKNNAAKIENNVSAGKLLLKNGNYYPIKTYLAFSEVDPLSSILSVLSNANQNDYAIIQYAIEAISSSWQNQAESYALHGTKREDGSYIPRTDQQVIKEKIKHPGFKASIRVASNNSELLGKISQSFNVFTRTDGNSFIFKKPMGFRSSGFIKCFNQRLAIDNQVLNIEELATLWHLPSEKIKTTGVTWGVQVLSDPPHNLPISDNTSESEREKMNFFAKTLFKNKDTIFGIKYIDRRRHMWAVGKTGTGKSTLIANMVIDDMKKNKGVCIIDPHGDLCETILDYIPRDRINDIVYFNPADKDYPITINPLEVTNKEEAELVVSGIVSIFNKIFGNSWGPRLEYILRNSLFTLSEIPNSTLQDIPSLLSNKGFRIKVVQKLTDPVLKSFWTDEFEKMPSNLQKEAISPILNKVGQFVTSPLIRRIIGEPKSSIKIDEIMNNGKILIVNLSQGRLEEDNAALLGAMLITKIQLAAMHRVGMPEGERKDFYLYVDEFQNFATNSFIKILSEARKYHLNLMLANQYMAQIPIEVQKAILGNAGTIISFGVGAEDARILFHEFAEVFKEKDLVNLQNFQIAIKLMIDGYSERPFVATTLPLPISKNQNKEKVINESRKRWGKKY